jgi:biopolymer transport protein ExbD
MNKLAFVKTPPPSAAAESQEIDVTPLMSMFIILIPFLVSMAVLTHVAIVEFSLPPNVGAGAGGGEKPKVKLTVVLTPAYLAITHGEEMLDSLPAAEGVYDLAAFAAKLAQRRGEVDIRDEVVVAVRDNIRFKNVVAVMDRCRDAGFAKVGLSSATADPRSGR